MSDFDNFVANKLNSGVAKTESGGEPKAAANAGTTDFDRFVASGGKAAADPSPKKSSIEPASNWDIEQYRGMKYKWGAAPTDKNKVYSDCSGFVQHFLKKQGIEAPRTAIAQYKTTARVDPSGLQPNDLVFMDTGAGNVSKQTQIEGGKHVTHVGVYVGNGMIAEMGSKGFKQIPLKERQHLVVGYGRSPKAYNPYSSLESLTSEMKARNPKPAKLTAEQKTQQVLDKWGVNYDDVLKTVGSGSNDRIPTSSGGFVLKSAITKEIAQKGGKPILGGRSIDWQTLDETAALEEQLASGKRFAIGTAPRHPEAMANMANLVNEAAASAVMGASPVAGFIPDDNPGKQFVKGALKGVSSMVNPIDQLAFAGQVATAVDKGDYTELVEGVKRMGTVWFDPNATVEEKGTQAAMIAGIAFGVWHGIKKVGKVPFVKDSVGKLKKAFEAEGMYGYSYKDLSEMSAMAYEPVQRIKKAALDQAAMDQTVAGEAGARRGKPKAAEQPVQQAAPASDAQTDVPPIAEEKPSYTKDDRYLDEARVLYTRNRLDELRVQRQQYAIYRTNEGQGRFREGTPPDVKKDWKKIDDEFKFLNQKLRDHEAAVKGIEATDPNAISPETLANMDAERRQGALYTQLHPDDPRIDPIADEFDPKLANYVEKEFGQPGESPWETMQRVQSEPVYQAKFESKAAEIQDKWRVWKDLSKRVFGGGKKGGVIAIYTKRNGKLVRMPQETSGFMVDDLGPAEWNMLHDFAEGYGNENYVIEASKVQEFEAARKRGASSPSGAKPVPMNEFATREGAPWREGAGTDSNPNVYPVQMMRDWLRSMNVPENEKMFREALDAELKKGGYTREDLEAGKKYWAGKADEIEAAADAGGNGETGRAAQAGQDNAAAENTQDRSGGAQGVKTEIGQQMSFAETGTKSGQLGLMEGEGVAEAAGKQTSKTSNNTKSKTPPSEAQTGMFDEPKAQQSMNLDEPKPAEKPMSLSEKIKAAKKAFEESDPEYQDPNVQHTQGGPFSDRQIKLWAYDALIKIVEAGEWAWSKAKEMIAKEGFSDAERVKAESYMREHAKEFGLDATDAPELAGGNTGIKNATLELEAEMGKIAQVESRGSKTSEQIAADIDAFGKTEEGKTFDPENFAGEIAAGKTELSYEAAVKAQAGKARLIAKVDKLAEELRGIEKEEGRKGKFFEKAKELEAARKALDEYGQIIHDAINTQWSNIGRLMQEETKLDYTDYKKIEARAKERKFYDEKDVKYADDIKRLIEENTRLNRRLNEYQANETKAWFGKKPEEVAAERRRKPVTERMKAHGKKLREEGLAELKALFESGATIPKVSGSLGGALDAAAANLKAAGAASKILMGFIEEGTAKTVQSALEMTQKILKDAGLDIKDQDILDQFEPAERRSIPEEKKAVAALKKELREMTSQAKARKEDRANSLEAKKAAERKAKAERRVAELEYEIANLEEAIEEGIYMERAKKSPQAKDEYIELLEAKKWAYQRAIDAKLNELDIDPKMRFALEVARTIRSIKLGSDIGTVLRQGLVGVVNPRAAADSFMKAWNASKSESAFKVLMKRLRERDVAGKPGYFMDKKTGLQLTDQLIQPEEIAVGRMLQKLPIVGKYYGARLERFQVTYINYLRANLMDQAAKKGMSMPELQSVARFINAVTGRSNAKTVPRFLELIMTSPRYELSRWESLFVEPVRNLKIASKGADGKWHLNKAAIFNMYQMGKGMALGVILYKAAEMFGAKTSWQPESPDFLKIRLGDTVIDMSAGMTPRLRDLFKMFASLRSPDWTSNMGKAIVGMVTRPLSPAIRTTAFWGSIASQMQQGTKWEDVRDPFSGYVVEGEEKGWAAAFPLVIKSFVDTTAKYGFLAGMGAFGTEFVGGGVSNYPEKKKKKRGRAYAAV